MNNDEFLRYVDNNRDCEQDRLDIAVKKGLIRARNDRFDTKKFLTLAAACVFTFAMCITINLKPFNTAAEAYYQNWNRTMPDIASALDGYINDIANNFKRYSGGE